MTASNAIIQPIPVASILCHSNVRLSNGYDNESLKDLAASLKAHGMLQPIVVRHRTTEELDNEPPESRRHFAIIAGRRRFMASILNDADEVPCIIAETDEAKAYELEITENIQREQMTLADTARAVRMLLLIHDKPAKVCEILGKSASWVSKHLTISAPNVPTAIAQMLDTNTVGDLETLLILCQIWKIKGEAAITTQTRMMRIADAGNMNRQIARDALAALRKPATGNTEPPAQPAQTTVTTRRHIVSADLQDPTDPATSFVTVLPIRYLAIIEANGGTAWLQQLIEQHQI